MSRNTQMQIQKETKKSVSKHRTLTRILFVVTAILWIISLFFYALLLIDTYSPYHLVYNGSGESMVPTIQEGYISVMKDVPFQDLKVGDIIEFKMRTDYEHGYGVHNSSDKAIVRGNYTIPPHSYVKNPPDDKDIGIKYIPDSYIIHRIVAIREAGSFGEEENYFDRALQTQGDNVPVPDQKYVMESGYVSKSVYIVPFGGRLLQELYIRKKIISLFVIAMIPTYICVVVIVIRRRPAEINSV